MVWDRIITTLWLGDIRHHGYIYNYLVKVMERFWPWLKETNVDIWKLVEKGNIQQPPMLKSDHRLYKRSGRSQRDVTHWFVNGHFEA